MSLRREYNQWVRTPIRASHHFVISHTGSRTTRHAEICKLDASIFVRQNICTLDVSMYHALIVKVYQAVKDLRDIHCDEMLGELSEFLADVMQ